MQIEPKILRVCPSWVEDPVAKEYNNIQRAIDAIPAWGKYIIQLCDNFSSVPELMLTNDRISVRIDGRGEYGINFLSTDPVCTLGDRKNLKFTNITYLRGGTLVTRSDCTLGFYDCQSVMCFLDIVEGKYSHAYIYNTKFFGASGYPAIQMCNGDSKLTIHESYIKGGQDHPALFFKSSSESKVKIRNSVILHYSGNGHYPIQKEAGTLVGIHAYKCVGNEMLCSHDIANRIEANNSNISDPEISF